MNTERTESCYLYIKLPRLRVELPPIPEDTSPRHVTVLYVGKVTEAQYDAICKAVASSGAGLHSGSVDFTLAGRVGYFNIESDFDADAAGSSRVAFAPVEITDDHGLYKMHVCAHAAVVSVAGLEDYQSRIKVFGGFNPHMTLGYLYPGHEYDGPWGKGCDHDIMATRLHCDWGSVRSVSISHGQIYDEQPNPSVYDAEAALELIRRLVNHEPTGREECLRLPKGTVAEDVVVAVAEYLDKTVGTIRAPSTNYPSLRRYLGKDPVTSLAELLEDDEWDPRDLFSLIEEDQE